MEAKLLKIYEYNEKLREQLEIQRIPVSEASRSLIEYCQNNSDYMVPSVLNTKRPDPYAETTGDCGCVLM
ncbi:G protein gamma subunit [Phycomyces blakesleeanus NRRL 1555(-)]|uniref:Guanine nucleotide-binding protein subunit gamma n=1 Tax=Phycomyces blakesleeanus (strain ATCC 8743b / DSM 1359 / FGSC 10004 / NBRC 33097 / NRRL 1555) TaxID=763407 RepID=A0A163CW18_PHYB8|nr:G protein gamma subunit [Phycomyces blakesleeanus NRRL 1555(-)]OAD66010.1 G protein gamma subunit [Phycomyces blakesleeanus NRRL 1555(-)]|eukprot:XP_018284050.1 G protein gamma subunit [Phycomyces blakesleeanus NRRL 1555(-)]